MYSKYMPTTDRLRTMFVSQINRFSKDSRVMLDGDAEALQYLDALDTMITVSPDLVSAFFFENIGKPYYSKIMDRDEEFLTTKLTDTIGAGPFGDLYKKIIDRWETLTEKNRNIIWDYFTVLTKISQKLSSS